MCKNKGDIKLNIKLEILKGYIWDIINSNLVDFEIDENNIASSVAIDVLSEIHDIIRNDDYTDFEAIEEMVCVFEKHKIDFGTRHDF